MPFVPEPIPDEFRSLDTSFLYGVLIVDGPAHQLASKLEPLVFWNITELFNFEVGFLAAHLHDDATILSGTIQSFDTGQCFRTKHIENLGLQRHGIGAYRRPALLVTAIQDTGDIGIGFYVI